MPRYLSMDPAGVDSQKPQGQQYVSTDPNAVDSAKGSAAPQQSSSNHPILAMLARLAGGVGSAAASPADVTIAGSAIPAAIAGGSESLAEWLEGSQQDPKRIAAESAIGAIPFAKLVKSGSMLAKMLKAGAIGGTSEAGRELARGEDISPGSIAAQAGLGAGTFGLLHSLMGLRGAGRAAPIKNPASYEVVPTSQTGEGMGVLSKTKIGNKTVTARNPVMPPTAIAGSATSPGLEPNLGQLPSRMDPLKGTAVTGYPYTAGEPSLSVPSVVRGPGAKSLRKDMADAIAAATRKTDAETAQRLYQEALDKGYTVDDPRFSGGFSEAGKDLSQGLKVAKRRPLVPPNKEDGGTGGGPAKNPLDALMEQLGMKTEPPAGTPAGTGATPESIAAAKAARDAELEAEAAGRARGVEQANALDARSQFRVVEPPATAIESQATHTDPIEPPAPISGRPQLAPAAMSPESIAFDQSLRDDAASRRGVTEEPKPSFRETDFRHASPIAPQTVQDAPGTTTGQPVESALLKFFKTPQGATGANYGLAKKAVQAGEIPTADYARDSHLLQLGREPEGPLAAGAKGDLLSDFLKTQGPKQSFDWPEAGGRFEMTPEGSHVQVPPEVQGGMAEPPVNPDAGASLAEDAPDWVKQQSSLIDHSKGESGAIDPRLLKFGTGGLGALLGAPTGAALDPDDPDAALKGALAGAVLGYAGGQGLESWRGAGSPGGGMGAAGAMENEAVNWRNAGLLATPAAQGKKVLSDISAQIGGGMEDLLNPATRHRGARTIQELLNVPQNARNYWEGFKNPAISEDVLGDAAKSAITKNRGALGWVTRPFAAAQYATTQALERAGRTPEEAREAIMMGDPMAARYKGDLLDKMGVYDAAQKLLDLQKYPVVRALRPFARIGTNIAIRGAQRIPGLSMVTGDPETRMARTLLGTGAVAAGALTGAGDTRTDEQGDETPAIVRGLRRAALASYGVPFTLGESLTGPKGIRELYYMTPGVSSTLPPLAPKDTFATFGKKFGKRWLDQMLPDWANPETASSESQR